MIYTQNCEKMKRTNNFMTFKIDNYTINSGTFTIGKGYELKIYENEKIR